MTTRSPNRANKRVVWNISGESFPDFEEVETRLDQRLRRALRWFSSIVFGTIITMLITELISRMI